MCSLVHANIFFILLSVPQNLLLQSTSSTPRWFWSRFWSRCFPADCEGHETRAVWKPPRASIPTWCGRCLGGSDLETVTCILTTGSPSPPYYSSLWNTECGTCIWDIYSTDQSFGVFYNKWMILFSKYALNWSEVKVKTFLILEKNNYFK